MARTIAKDHDAKRDHILRTAAQVFASEGIARASMAQVAQACGISKANIYHYYNSKESLLFDILDSYLSRLRDRVCNLDVDSLPPEDKLRRILRETLLAYEGMDAEHKIQTEGIAMLRAEQQVILRGYQREMVRQLSLVLSAIAPGRFEGDSAKLRAATMSIFGMLNWFYMWNRDASSRSRVEYARLVADLALNGVKGI